jgi:SAM-dependent methyltransferase
VGTHDAAEALPSARYSELDFNAPLDSAHAQRLIASLRPLVGTSIADLGCGWAELLLRALEAEPTADGVGVDRAADVLARAQRNAKKRGLQDRVRFECAAASAYSQRADVAIVVGSSHAWDGTQAMLEAMRTLLRPGGRLLLGEGIWEQSPTPEALAALDAQPDDFATASGLVDLCAEQGYRLLALSTASLAEWDDFESRFAAGRERWLRQYPDAPEAIEVRAELDAHRHGWLRGYRGVLGFAYLTLVRSA